MDSHADQQKPLSFLDSHLLQQFEIRVGMDASLPDVDNPRNDLCYYQNDLIPASATESFICTRPLFGVYLSIQQRFPRVLTLCEVEAFGVCKYCNKILGSKITVISHSLELSTDRSFPGDG